MEKAKLCSPGHRDVAHRNSQFTVRWQVIKRQKRLCMELSVLRVCKRKQFEYLAPICGVHKCHIPHWIQVVAQAHLWWQYPLVGRVDRLSSGKKLVCTVLHVLE